MDFDITNKTSSKVWCFDITNGWTKIEDIVWSTCLDNDTPDIQAGRVEAGFERNILNVGTNLYLGFSVFKRDEEMSPGYFVAMNVRNKCVEYFYVANLPSLLAWLKDNTGHILDYVDDHTGIQ